VNGEAHDNPRRAYFDELSERWDQIYDIGRARPLLCAGLERLGVAPGERVVDLGCGTGVLLGCLIDHLGPAGRIEAIDLAPRMIAASRRKFPDPRVSYHVADAASLPLEDNSIDRLICFSAWPHFPDPDAVVQEAARVLRPGSRLHVWHIDSRQKINDIHRNAGPAVQRDFLEEAPALADRMQRCGMQIESIRDDDEAYEVGASMPYTTT